MRVCWSNKKHILLEHKYKKIIEDTSLTDSCLLLLFFSPLVFPNLMSCLSGPFWFENL